MYNILQCCRPLCVVYCNNFIINFNLLVVIILQGHNELCPCRLLPTVSCEHDSSCPYITILFTFWVTIIRYKMRLLRGVLVNTGDGSIYHFVFNILWKNFVNLASPFYSIKDYPLIHSYLTAYSIITYSYPVIIPVSAHLFYI